MDQNKGYTYFECFTSAKQFPILKNTALKLKQAAIIQNKFESYSQIMRKYEWKFIDSIIRNQELC